MEIQDFICLIEDEFEEIPNGTLAGKSIFRDLESWSSMHALLFVALIDHNYNVLLNGDELKGAITIEDLFLLIKSKM
jgi:hypothetical protein